MKRAIARLEEAIISLLLVAMTLLVFIEVVLRFVFNTGFIWAQEATLYLSAWFVLLGTSYGVKVGAHIGVDALVKLFPPRIRRGVTLAALALCLFYCALFFYGSWIYLSKVRMIGIEMEDLPIPKWMAMNVLLIGFALLAFRFLQLAWAVITGKSDGFHLADEAKESMHLKQEVEAEFNQSKQANSPAKQEATP